VRLTVVVPVWGRYVAWLSECVESIWSQRDEVPFRLIVIDNASDEPLPVLPDGVEVDRLARRQTLGAARNRGLELTDTELVSFCDADDLFPGGYFSFAVERLSARRELVAVGTRPVALLADGSERLFPWPSDASLAASHHRRRLAIRNLLREPSLPMGGSTFRAEALRRAGGYSDLDYNEDANLSLLLPFLGEVELHAGPSRRYRIHAGTVSRNAPDDNVVRASFADARRRLRRHPEIPIWAKALLPLATIHHRRQAAAARRGDYAARVEAAVGVAQRLEGMRS
jgi:glycosyltransferase involved in cell wall biosynthesis